MEKMNFEAALARLEEINRRLSEEGVGLEEGMALYEEGVLLAGKCRQILEEAKSKIDEQK